MKKQAWVLLLAMLFVWMTVQTAWMDEAPAPTEQPPLDGGVPGIRILSPTAADSVAGDGVLMVDVEGVLLTKIEVIATWGEERSASIEVEGSSAYVTLQLTQAAGPVTVIARGYGQDSDGTKPTVEHIVTLRCARDELIDRMIALALKNSKEKKYKFAPAQTDTDIAVCKNFVMRLFDTYKKEYYMQEFPDLPLHMPLNRRLVECKPYQYGIEWAIEGPEDGSPFEIVAQFKYNPDLSKAENQQLAREVLYNAKRGDFYQMVGNYVDGNGPHSLLMIEDYNPESDKLTWTDSNMKGTRIDGVRWGYLQYGTERTVEWMVKAICTKNRGATLYRLRGDLVHKPETAQQ